MVNLVIFNGLFNHKTITGGEKIALVIIQIWQLLYYTLRQMFYRHRQYLLAF